MLSGMVYPIGMNTSPNTPAKTTHQNLTTLQVRELKETATLAREQARRDARAAKARRIAAGKLLANESTKRAIIAKLEADLCRQLGRDTLDPQNSDRADFCDVSVITLRDLIAEAVRAGLALR